MPQTLAAAAPVADAPVGGSLLVAVAAAMSDEAIIGFEDCLTLVDALVALDREGAAALPVHGRDVADVLVLTQQSIAFLTTLQAAAVQVLTAATAEQKVGERYGPDHDPSPAAFGRIEGRARRAVLDEAVATLGWDPDRRALMNRLANGAAERTQVAARLLGEGVLTPEMVRVLTSRRSEHLTDPQLAWLTRHVAGLTHPCAPELAAAAAGTPADAAPGGVPFRRCGARAVLRARAAQARREALVEATGWTVGDWVDPELPALSWVVFRDRFDQGLAWLLDEDPDVAGDREQAMAERRASSRLHPDGTGEVNVTGDAAAVAAAHNRIHQMARRARQLGDPRTMGQLGADLALGLLLHGHHPNHPDHPVSCHGDPSRPAETNSDAPMRAGSAGADAGSDTSAAGAGSDIFAAADPCSGARSSDAPMRAGSAAADAGNDSDVPRCADATSADARSHSHAPTGVAASGADGGIDSDAPMDADPLLPCPDLADHLAAQPSSSLPGDLIGPRPFPPSDLPPSDLSPSDPTPPWPDRAVPAPSTVGEELLNGFDGVRPVMAILNITVSLETLLGTSSPPARLYGGPVRGYLTAAQVRAVALAGGGIWRRIVTDPVSGVALNTPVRSYQPGRAMRDHLAVLDNGCRAPGCLRHHDLQLDHVWPHSEGGATMGDNLHTLDANHHHHKTEGLWHVTPVHVDGPRSGGQAADDPSHVGPSVDVPTTAGPNAGPTADTQGPASRAACGPTTAGPTADEPTPVVATPVDPDPAAPGHADLGGHDSVSSVLDALVDGRTDWPERHLRWTLPTGRTVVTRPTPYPRPEHLCPPPPGHVARDAELDRWYEGLLGGLDGLDSVRATPRLPYTHWHPTAPGTTGPAFGRLPQPAAGQPAPGQSAAGQPALGQPSQGQPSAEQHAPEQPETGQPPAEGPPAPRTVESGDDGPPFRWGGGWRQGRSSGVGGRRRGRRALRHLTPEGAATRTSAPVSRAGASRSPRRRRRRGRFGGGVAGGARAALGLRPPGGRPWRGSVHQRGGAGVESAFDRRVGVEVVVGRPWLVGRPTGGSRAGDAETVQPVEQHLAEQGHQGAPFESGRSTRSRLASVSRARNRVSCSL